MDVSIKVDHIATSDTNAMGFVADVTRWVGHMVLFRLKLESKEDKVTGGASLYYLLCVRSIKG